MRVGVQLSVGIGIKLMVIKQQLQVTNLAASLGRSQVGNVAIANFERYNWHRLIIQAVCKVPLIIY